MQTPALNHLLGVYFHEDWDLEGTEEQVLDEFVHDEPDLGAALPDEIERLLIAFPRDTDLAQHLEAKGCYYAPDGGGGYRAWLADVAAHVRKQLSRP